MPTSPRFEIRNTNEQPFAAGPRSSDRPFALVTAVRRNFKKGVRLIDRYSTHAEAVAAIRVLESRS